MKKIEALFRPFKLEEVRDGLTSLGVHGMTISEVVGCGTRNGPLHPHHTAEYAPEFQPKIKLEVVVIDDLSGPVVAAIAKAARSGSVDDGNIFISQVNEVVRIRTNEADKLAVC
jgi:nitrogen regulatory protein PII